MSLELFYTPEDDAVFLSSQVRSHFGADLPDDCGVIVRHLEDAYDPVELEVLGISAYLPLETNDGYCAETDTLTFGRALTDANVVIERDDLIAYWLPDGYSSNELALTAVALRNASKHLAPVIDAMTGVPARQRG